mmetsp:Transcript_43421/g.115229  ORF Transcript_43421/g.115229 Transcript_43421/m.115229 type:complete len:343 (-) Transcript_43421:81-1109(-)
MPPVGVRPAPAREIRAGIRSDRVPCRQLLVEESVEALRAQPRRQLLQQRIQLLLVAHLEPLLLRGLGRALSHGARAAQRLAREVADAEEDGRQMVARQVPAHDGPATRLGGRVGEVRAAVQLVYAEADDPRALGRVPRPDHVLHLTRVWRELHPRVLGCLLRERLQHVPHRVNRRGHTAALEGLQRLLGKGKRVGQAEVVEGHHGQRLRPRSLHASGVPDHVQLGAKGVPQPEHRHALHRPAVAVGRQCEGVPEPRVGAGGQGSVVRVRLVRHRDNGAACAVGQGPQQAVVAQLRVLPQHGAPEEEHDPPGELARGHDHLAVPEPFPALGAAPLARQRRELP